MRWRNWARTKSATSLGVVRPDSEDELCQFVQATASRGERIKVAGAGHSVSAIAAPEGTWLLELDRLERFHGFDRGRHMVTFGAGTSLTEVNEKLDSLDLALPNLGTISAQTLGGALATATHGSGLTYGVLATHVRSLRMVRADGNPIKINADHSDAFLASGVSLGALGVMTEVTIACERAFRLKLRQRKTTLESVENRASSLFKSEHFKLLLIPHTNAVFQWTAHRTKAPITQIENYLGWLKARCLGNTLHEILLLSGMQSRSGQVRVNKWLAESVFGPSAERVDKSYKIFNIPITIRQHVAEYAIPIRYTFDALQALTELVDRKELCVHAPIEVRFSAADDFWLSPAFGRCSCYIGVIMYRPYGREPAYRDYFLAVEEIMSRFGGRPHWGKWFREDPERIRKNYPKWAQFSELRQGWDPSGLFLNPFLDRLFG